MGMPYLGEDGNLTYRKSTSHQPTIAPAVGRCQALDGRRSLGTASAAMSAPFLPAASYSSPAMGCCPGESGGKPFRAWPRWKWAMADQSCNRWKSQHLSGTVGEARSTDWEPAIARRVSARAD